MKRFHPHVKHLVAISALALSVQSGCRSNGGGIASNPFFAPDRVPPPATRALAPGQAQPYYPGDPLPVMQSATGQPSGEVVKSEGGIQEVSSTGRVLAWNTPSSGPVQESPPTAPSPTTVTATQSVSPPREGTVAIPVDGDSLRFALPQPVTAQPPAIIASNQATAATPPQQLAASQPAQSGVVPASYYEPDAAQSAASEAQTIPVPQIASSQWQSPQINSRVAATPTLGPPATSVASAPRIALPPPPAMPMYQATAIPNSNTMAVELRAVPSPPPQPGGPMPRIRMPSYAEPIQTVSVADGFRPRTSMR
jgi:hypothetical protein